MRRVISAAGQAEAVPARHAARAAARGRGAGRRSRILVAGVAGSLALSVLGGCASAPPAESALRGQPVAARSPVVPCTTTWLVLATVSKCGSGGPTFGVAAE